MGPVSEELFGPGLGETQRLLLATLKRRGPSTLAELKAEMGLAAATLHEHVQSLAGRGLVERVGTRRHARGRPEVVYQLAAAGERLFPHAEAEILQELVAFLTRAGQGTLVAEFFEARAAARREAAVDRVAGLHGADRWSEVARIFSEQGFMAESGTAPDGTPELRFHHCPLRSTAAVTDVPCRAEVSLAEMLVGQPLQRVEHAAHRSGACTYAASRSL